MMRNIFIALVSLLVFSLHASQRKAQPCIKAPTCVDTPQPTITEQHVYKTIFKALNALAKKDKNLKTIDRLIGSAKSDLICLKNQKSLIKQKKLAFLGQNAPRLSQIATYRPFLIQEKGFSRLRF